VADGATVSAVISIAMNTATERRRVLMIDNLAVRRSGSQHYLSDWQTVDR